MTGPGGVSVFAQALAEVTLQHGPSCSVGGMIEALLQSGDEADVELGQEILEALKKPKEEIGHATISRALKALEITRPDGGQISADSIRRHRDGACNCGHH